MVVKRFREIAGIRTKNKNFRKIYRNTIPSTTYLTHGIHAYTAKLIPHIPRHFIPKYTGKADLILDPFCGSGTTLLEAKLMGRNAVGIDINPLAILISEVKTPPLKIDDVSDAIETVKNDLKKSNKMTSVRFPNIDYWFCKKAQNELSRIKHCIENSNGENDAYTYKFLLLCFSSIIRKSSYADPRMAKTYKSKRVVEKIKNRWVPTPIQYFEEALNKNLKKIKAMSEKMWSSNNYVKVFHGDARETEIVLKKNGIEKVDFVITSPPYINAQDYFRSYKLEIWWLGLATPEEVKYLNKCAVGTEIVSRKSCAQKPSSDFQRLNSILDEIWKTNKKKSYVVYNYFENMARVFLQCCRVLKKEGYFCLIIGDNTICNVPIPTHKILIDIAHQAGFQPVEKVRNEIKNRALPPKRNHHKGIIKEEWITVFRKRGDSK